MYKRTIIDICYGADGHKVLTLECGHHPEPNPAMCHKLGDQYRCYQCQYPHHRYTPVEALNLACHTYERMYEGTLYTISDIRHPDLNGRQVWARLDHGITVYSWKD